MKRIFFFVFIIINFLVWLKNPDVAESYYSYEIQSFKSQIIIEKDTSISVKETIDVDFKTPKHGIYRILPVYYTHNGKTINSRIKILSISDDSGNSFVYQTKRIGQGLEIKIGNPDIKHTGRNVYIISYRASGIIQRFNDHEELYWNVTGHDWDEVIEKASVFVESNYAIIEKADCFTGKYGTKENQCLLEFSKNRFNSIVQKPISPGDDFSVVLALSKDNNLVFPSGLEKLAIIFSENWGYLVSFLPSFLIFYFWYKKGRDFRYISENIYFEPEDKAKRQVKLFERPHIPFVYHPIAKITPGEAGTILDERVDISDVVSEILELSRLGFIKIQKIESKKLFSKSVDYAFIKTEKFDSNEDRNKLHDYQNHILKELFRSTIIHKSIENAEKIFKANDEKLSEVRKLLINKKYVLLSGIKLHFYESLPLFKSKLYGHMKDENIFEGDPEKVKGNWIGFFILYNLIVVCVVLWFVNTTANYFPLISQAILFAPGLLFAISMPRRTPKGYSYYRQIKGLQWFLERGRWRYEIAEKQLFIEEILPLAISLGVVNNISKDMSELGIKPPSYFSGSTVGSFSRDLTYFNSATISSLLTAPPGKISGASSWSGGSGFSGGGSSGGGFGGGGGGSW